MSEEFNQNADIDAILDQLVSDEPAPHIEEPKAEEPVVEEVVAEKAPEVVEAPEPVVEQQGIGIVNGAIGVAVTKSSKTTKKSTPAKEKTFSYLWSDRSLYWNGVGNLNKGFNAVDKSKEDKWLSKGGVRKATQDEIDKEYGR